MSNDSNDKKNDRRSFLKMSALGILGAAVAAKIGAPDIAHAQAGQDVKESDANAKALGYYENADKVDLKKFPKRAGAEGKKQHCYNCMFYQSKEADPSKSAKAPCTIFANKNVKAKAWCNSWAQNPKVKN